MNREKANIIKKIKDIVEDHLGNTEIDSVALF